MIGELIMRKVLLFILIAMLLTGCGSKEGTTGNNDKAVNENNGTDNKQDDSSSNMEPSGYSFVYNNVSIYMNTDVVPVIDALGEELHYFEAESCAFKGLDKFYTYPGFE